jgi:hypothetical protein
VKFNLKKVLIASSIAIIILILFLYKSNIFLENNKKYENKLENNKSFDNNEIEIKKEKDNAKDIEINKEEEKSQDEEQKTKTEEAETNGEIKSDNLSDNNISNSEVKKDNSNKNSSVNQESTPSVNTQEQINNELRNQIKAKYGVNVGYKDEIDGNYYNSYATPTKLYDDNEIYDHLNKINVALSKYPSSFFYEIKNKWKQVTIYLVKNINSSDAALTDNSNPNTMVILIATGGFLFESTLHHEMMHYIDCYLSNLIGANTLENSMMQINPSGFTYGNKNNDYVYYYANPYYFISAYAKSNYLEDRAVIFEDLMFRSLKKEYYTKDNPINEKAKIISQQLTAYFDCVSDGVTEHWERFIAY